MMKTVNVLGVMRQERAAGPLVTTPMWMTCDFDTFGCAGCCDNTQVENNKSENWVFFD